MRAASNILHLGVKELRSLIRDPLMLGLIVFAFTFAIYSAATALPETLNRAPIEIVHEDNSPLSRRIADAFQPPYFLPPVMITQAEMDARMDMPGSTPSPSTSRPISSATCSPGARRRSSSTSTPLA